MRFRLGKRAIVLCAIIALGAAPARSAESVRVSAFVQPEGPVTDTQQLNLVIRVEGGDAGDVTVGRLPPLTNLRVIGGPSVSNEFSWVNGRSSSTSSRVFGLLPEHPGPAEIPSISVRVGSTTYQTEPIRLLVESGPARPQSRSGQPRGGRSNEKPGSTEGKASADVFLEATLGTSEVWVGEPVLLSVTLFSSTQVANLTWMQVPSFSSFWVEEMQTDIEAERYRTTIAGRPYNAFPLAKKILVPTTPADVTLEPFAAQMEVSRSTGDFFSDFFQQNRVQRIIRKTEPLGLRVKPLPAGGRPEGFSGAVGSFRMQVTLDRREVSVNDAVALRVVIAGEGSLQSASAPKLEVPPDLKVFEPKVALSSSVSGGKLSSRKTWEWILVPLVPGEIRLPPIRFAYFDPAQASYREARNESMQLAVRRGEGASEGPAARGEVRAQRQEIAFIKPSGGGLDKGHPRLHSSALYKAALLLPLGLVPLVIVLGRRRMRFLQDRGLARSHRARATARKRFQTAEHLMAKPDPGAFHVEVARALMDYVADRFNRSPTGLTYDLADALLTSRGVDAELRRRLRSCVEACDFARFVPSAGRPERRSDLLKDARELVDLLEKSL